MHNTHKRGTGNKKKRNKKNKTHKKGGFRGNNFLKRFRKQEQEVIPPMKWRTAPPSEELPEYEYSSIPDEWKQFEILTNERKCDNNVDGCKMDSLALSSNIQCDWSKRMELSVILPTLVDSRTPNIITIKYSGNGNQMGNLDCKTLTNKINKLYNKINNYKNCNAFKTIDTIRIFGHNFKQTQLSLVKLSFKLFPNINTIVLGVDPNDFSPEIFSDFNRECLEEKYNIEIQLLDGIEGLVLSVKRLL